MKAAPKANHPWKNLGTASFTCMEGNHAAHTVASSIDHKRWLCPLHLEGYDKSVAAK